jgi:hypothetical protein
MAAVAWPGANTTAASACCCMGTSAAVVSLQQTAAIETGAYYELQKINRAQVQRIALSRAWRSMNALLSTAGAHATSTLMLTALMAATHLSNHTCILQTALRAAMLPGEQHNATSF